MGPLREHFEFAQLSQAAHSIFSRESPSTRGQTTSIFLEAGSPGSYFLYRVSNNCWSTGKGVWGKSALQYQSTRARIESTLERPVSFSRSATITTGQGVG